MRHPVGAVFNRTASAHLKTAPTKQKNGRFIFLTAPVWRVPLILKSTINKAGDSPNIGNTELGQLRMGGSLWENQGAYIKNSPIFYLDRVETPLLLIHGELETRFTVQLGELFSGLRRLGKEVVLATYLGEDHDLGSWLYPNAIDRWKRILAWFDEHLKC